MLVCTHIKSNRSAEDYFPLLNVKTDCKTIGRAHFINYTAKFAHIFKL